MMDSSTKKGGNKNILPFIISRVTLLLSLGTTRRCGVEAQSKLTFSLLLTETNMLSK